MPNLRIKIGESQSIVNHKDDHYREAAWRARYATMDKGDAMALASVYEDFDCLFEMTNAERNRAINAVKRAKLEIAKE